MVKGWTVERIHLTSKIHALLFLVLGAIFYALKFTDTFDVNLLFEVVALSLLLEITVRCTYIYCKRKERMSRFSLVFFAIFTFGFGFAIQLTTKSGSQYCWPHSWFQGHAIWHLCASLGCLFTFFFFLSEKFTFQRRKGEVGEDDLDEFIDDVILDIANRNLQNLQKFASKFDNDVNLDANFDKNKEFPC